MPSCGNLRKIRRRLIQFLEEPFMALLEFRSKAAAGFYMMSDTFKAVCRVLGRDYGESGCLPPEDLPPLIEKLSDEIEREKAWIAEQAAKREKLEREGRGGFMTFEEEEEEKKAREHVPMSVRIFPLLDMMQKAAKMKQNVMWGVP